MAWLDPFIWWNGVFWLTAFAIYGLSEFGLWIACRVLRSLGHWPAFIMVLRRMRLEGADVAHDA